MPIPGISLLGFMSQAQALNYLRAACVTEAADDDDAPLIEEWRSAQKKLGPAPLNAGYPAVEPIPATDEAYIRDLQQGPWREFFEQNPSWQFRLVEIEPLLAWQFSILTEKSTAHCSALNPMPSVSDLLPICLPQTPPKSSAHVSRTQQSVMIQSRDLNLRAVEAGLLGNVMGLHFQFALPFVHVVRFNGRCYLLNGFHRTYGAAMAGAKAIPCVFREVGTQYEAGIREEGANFSLEQLEGAKPPTLHHFVSGQAHPIQLKPMNRVLHVSWAEYLVPDEEF